MNVFLDTLNQTLVLFLLIAVGYILAKLKIIPNDGVKVLSRLENTLIIPALVMGTFISNFTVKNLAEYGKLITLSFVLFAGVLVIAIIASRLIYRDSYRRKIALYGLSFSNFGFMGNAVVLALYGTEFFSKYAVFVIPLWIMIYIWGVPSLLLSNEEEKNTQGATRVKFLLKKLKPLVNPMFVAMIIGMLLGLIDIESLLKSALGDMMPEKIFFLSAIEQTGSCMSVLAMIITGMTIAQTDIMYILKNVPIYILTVVRLLVIPLAFIFVFWLIPENSLTKDVTFLTCAICALSMPLGLNTIVVPGAYGKDTRDAAGMALISHALAVVTIPLIFMIFHSVLIA